MQATNRYGWIMKKLARITLVGLLAGLSDCASNSERNYTIQMSLDLSSAIVLEYNKKHVVSRHRRDVYERYEHKGFDGANYCMQVFRIQEGGSMTVTDWEDGTCDGIPETVAVESPNGNYIFFCEKEERELLESSDLTRSCQVFKDGGLLDGFADKFRRKNHVDFVVQTWNHYRDSCNEKVCYSVLQPPNNMSMSKKKVK